MGRSLLEFLHDARLNAQDALSYAELDEGVFVSSGVPVEAIYHLLILGEALKNVPTPIRSLAPAIPCRFVIGMRDVLIHRYWEIDLETVYRVLTNDLPPLMQAIDDLIEMVEQGGR